MKPIAIYIHTYIIIYIQNIHLGNINSYWYTRMLYK